MIKPMVMLAMSDIVLTKVTRRNKMKAHMSIMTAAELEICAVDKLNAWAMESAAVIMTATGPTKTAQII